MLLALAAALAPTGDSQLRAELAITPAGELELQSHSKRREVNPTEGEESEGDGKLATSTDGKMFPRATQWQHADSIDTCALALLRLGWQVVDPTGEEMALENGNLPMKLMYKPQGLPAAPPGVMQYSKSPTDYPGYVDAWAYLDGDTTTVQDFEILPRLAASELEVEPAADATKTAAAADGQKAGTATDGKAAGAATDGKAAGAATGDAKAATGAHAKAKTTTTTTTRFLSVSTTTSTTTLYEESVEALEPCDAFPCRGLRDAMEQRVVGLLEKDPRHCTMALDVEGYQVTPPPPPPMRAGFTLRAAKGERPGPEEEPEQIVSDMTNASIKTEHVNISDSFENKTSDGLQFKKTLVPNPNGLDGSMKEVLTPLPVHEMGKSCVDFDAECETRAKGNWCSQNPQEAREMCCRACGLGLVPIANDGFEMDNLEAPQVANGWTYVQGSPLANEASPALTDWRVQGNVALSKNGNTAWGGLDSGAGAAYVVLVDGQIEQTIGELTVGQQYTIRFRDAAKPAGSASDPQSLVLKLRNDTATEEIIQEWQNEPSKAFSDEAVEFVATEPKLVLSFENTSPNATGIFVDDVRVMEGGVRETEPFTPLDVPVNADHITYSEPTFGEGF